MRILIVGLNYAPEPTGNAPYTTELAESLHRSGHEVRVITGYPHYPQWRVLEGYSGMRRHEIIGNVSVTRVRHTVPRRPTSSLGRVVSEVSFGLHAIVVPWKHPDVVLAVSPALFASGLVALRTRAAPHRAFTVWVQDLYSKGMRETDNNTSPLRNLLARAVSNVESWILGAADGVVVIHERFRTSVVELGVQVERVEVIHNWSHLSDGNLPADRATTRSRLGWREDEIVVLHAGNMGAKQGLESVVDAALLLEDPRRQDELPDAAGRLRFVLMGQGNQCGNLRSRGHNCGHIQFVDPLPRDEFRCAMHAADVLLVNERPGVREMSVPSKLTSYYSTGRPVLVATDIGSVSAAEIQLSGGGIRTDAGDPVALIRAACTLGTNPVLAASMGERGKVFRTTHLTAESALHRYHQFLSQVASAVMKVAEGRSGESPRRARRMWAPIGGSSTKNGASSS